MAQAADRLGPKDKKGVGGGLGPSLVLILSVCSVLLYGVQFAEPSRHSGASSLEILLLTLRIKSRLPTTSRA
jgi:hypothetical protein